MVRSVFLENSKILRRTMPDVKPPFGEGVMTALTDLRDTMFEIGAVGLAANQIGFELNIAIIALANDKVLELINPAIIKKGKRYYSVEGCVSIPNYTAIIPRVDEVQVAHLTRDGKQKLVTLALPYSVRAQHEIDHLRGILIRDYVDGVGNLKGGMDATKGSKE